MKDDLWRPIQGGIEVQASNRLAMVGECEDTCSATSQYSWTMYRKGLHNSWLEIEAEELELYATGRRRAKNSIMRSSEFDYFKESLSNALSFIHLQKNKIRLVCSEIMGVVFLP